MTNEKSKSECPKCGSHNIIMFTSDDDLCQSCEYVFPGVLGSRIAAPKPDEECILSLLPSDVASLRNQIERLKELSEAQSNYIDFLSAAVSQPVSFLHTHNWHYNEEDVKEGKELREKISEIKMKFPKR